MRNLTEIPFTSRFTNELPGDASKTPGSRHTSKVTYALVDPKPVTAPKLIGWSDDMAEKFDLEIPQGPSLDLLAGNRVLEGMKPYAACYGGHQFGNWAHQLGDGRATTLGEIADQQGQLWELQLKGAGQTPYSRHADGRAVLRSSLCEFLASEAMYHLGVPTTRALSLVMTGDSVNRDMFYDGNSKDEPGAITTRMAPTFVRFGNFEILAAREELEIHKQLADWTIRHHFKNIDLNSPKAYADWFRQVCDSTAKMIVEWLRVGFVHGVMNTDNMSVLGLTIDYGPYGFLDNYDPAWTPNTTDLPGRRYCYGQQAPIALWNLRAFAHAVSPLFKDPDSLNESLESFVKTYEKGFAKMMAGKLGLRNLEGEADVGLVNRLNQLLQELDADMTIFFRNLIHGSVDKLASSFYAPAHADTLAGLTKWLKEFEARVKQDNMDAGDRRNLMNQMNPKIIPRNYLLFNVIQDVEKGDLSSFNELYAALRNPYEDVAKWEHLAGMRPDWARETPGSSTLSCSS